MDLDENAMARRFETAGHTILFYPEVESTQDTAHDLARRGAGSGLVVMAGRQTAGRGARGDTWHAERNAAMLLSILLQKPPADVPLTWLTIAASVAIHDAIADVCGVDCSLAWPNDVLVDHKKLAGVLTEAPADLDLAIVGIGINLLPPIATLTPDAVPPIGLYESVGGPIDRAALIGALVRRLDEAHARLVRGDVATVRACWRGLLMTIGKLVTITTGEAVHRGIAIDVDEQGAIILRFKNGATQRFASGRLREVLSPQPLAERSGMAESVAR